MSAVSTTYVPSTKGDEEVINKTVGIIGIGNMGGAIAENLLRRGWRVGVLDIDCEKTKALSLHGAEILEHPSELANFCSTIIIAVVTAQQVAQVLESLNSKGECLLSNLSAGHSVMLCPTISPDDVMGFAKTIEHQGAGVIDSPMSGGPARAKEGRMSLMVACSMRLLTLHQVLLNDIADPVFFISERVGDGAKTKLINNLLAGINLVASAELLSMAEKVGLDLQKTLKVIESSSGQSWVCSDRMGRAVAGDPLQLVPLAHMTLLEKDTRMALEMGLRAGYQGPLGASAVKAFKDASASGLAGCDDAAMLSFLRNFTPQV